MWSFQTADKDDAWQLEPPARLFIHEVIVGTGVGIEETLGAGEGRAVGVGEGAKVEVGAEEGTDEGSGG